MDWKNYQGSACYVLDRYFSNVWIAFLGHTNRFEVNFDRLKETFIGRLEAAIEGNPHEYKSVNAMHLREMVELARNDWRNFETIKNLYKRKYELAGKTIDLAIFRIRS